MLIGVFLMINHLYGLIYTTIVYHDLYESMHALIFGLLIVFLTFTVDAFSNSLYYSTVVSLIFRNQDNCLDREVF